MSDYAPVYIKISAGMENFGGYAKVGENLPDACRRLYRQRFNAEPIIESERKVDFMSIEEVDSRIKSGWPVGLRSIPVYYYICKDGKQD